MLRGPYFSQSRDIHCLACSPEPRRWCPSSLLCLFSLNPLCSQLQGWILTVARGFSNLWFQFSLPSFPAPKVLHNMVRFSEGSKASTPLPGLEEPQPMEEEPARWTQLLVGL